MGSTVARSVVADAATHVVNASRLARSQGSVQALYLSQENNTLSLLSLRGEFAAFEERALWEGF